MFDFVRKDKQYGSDPSGPTPERSFKASLFLLPKEGGFRAKDREDCKHRNSINLRWAKETVPLTRFV